MRAATWVSCVVLLGCSQGPLTQILVVTDTDLAVPEELERVRFDVSGPRGNVQSASADLASARPARLALVHREGPLGPFTIEATGELGTGIVVRRSARVAFIPGEVRVLRLALLERCVDVRCGEDETCGEQGCRSIEVDASELEPWNAAPVDGSVPLACGERPSCDDGIDCTHDACLDDVCESQPEATRCADDGVACTIERCDPELGCISEPSDAACDDGVACTVDRCEPAGCASSPVHASCAPGQWCDPSASCVRAPTFSEVYALFRDRCGTCHMRGHESEGGLDISSRSAAWRNLVGVPSRCDGSARVVPRDARASLLWRKIARVDLCGQRMPPSGMPISSDEAALVERWIAGGALDD